MKNVPDKQKITAASLEVIFLLISYFLSFIFCFLTKKIMKSLNKIY